MKPNEVTASTIKAERLQTRANTSAEYVDELAERMIAGDVFPAVVVFSDGKDSWLADGIHRLDAAIKAKVKIGVDQKKGARAEAVEWACGANASHGLRLTPADKRRKVALALSEFPDRSSRSIAELCGVSDHLVEDVRSASGAHSRTGNSPTSTAHSRSSSNGQPAKRIGRDGKKQAAKKRPKISGGTSFDPAELEKQRAKPGTQRRKPADRKAALLLLGKLVRALDRLGLSADLDSELKAINKALKES